MKDEDELLSKSPGDGTFTWARSDERIISDNSPSGRMLGSGGGLSFMVIALNKNLHSRFINPDFTEVQKRKPSCNYPNSGCISPPKNLTSAEKKTYFIYVYKYIHLYIWLIYVLNYIYHIRQNKESQFIYTCIFSLFLDGGCVAHGGHAGSNWQVKGVLEPLAPPRSHI